VRPKDELEEALLITAWQRKQHIRALETAALVTAAVNPDKAHDAYMNYLRMLLPEYNKIRAEMDTRLMETFEAEKEVLFQLQPAAHGFLATERKLNA
jgi:hypothetical protein